MPPFLFEPSSLLASSLKFLLKVVFERLLQRPVRLKQTIIKAPRRHFKQLKQTRRDRQLNVTYRDHNEEGSVGPRSSAGRRSLEPGPLLTTSPRVTTPGAWLRPAAGYHAQADKRTSALTVEGWSNRRSTGLWSWARPAAVC